MEQGKDWATLVARILLSTLFILDGLAKFPGYAASLAYFQSKGVPLLPFTVWLAIVIEVGGGAMVLLGFNTRSAAVALSLFCLTAPLLGHTFWRMPPSGARINDMYHFAKDFGLSGGFLLLAVHGPGGFSLDHLRLARNAARGTPIRQ